MKSTGLLATLISALFAQISNGQQHGLVNGQNFDTNSIVPQWLPPHKMVTGNTDALANIGNRQQVQMQTTTPPPLPITQKVQPPEVKERNPQLHLTLQQQQPSMLRQPLQLQPTLSTQQPSPLQQAVQAQQQPLQENPTPQLSTFQQNLKLAQLAALQQNNYQPSLNALSKSQLPSPQSPINVGFPPNTPSINMQSKQNSMLNQPEVVNIPQLVPDKPQEASAVRYQIATQQSSLSALNTPVHPNSPSIALIPSYSIKPMDQTYTSPYKYTKPSPEVQTAVIEKTPGPNPVPSLSSILTLPSVPVQNTQTYNYNHQTADPRQNLYITSNPGFRYDQQSQIPVAVLQSQPAAALIPRQPSVVSSVPLSVIQTVVPQYGVPSRYPAATTVYASRRPKSPDLKAFLPLIFNLLREKIASSGCRSGCPCECDNQTENKEPEVSAGYSSLKHYGVLNDNSASAFNTVSERCEGAGERARSLRERKNCVKKIAPEIIDETQEEEDDDSDEEEVEEEDEEE